MADPFTPVVQLDLETASALAFQDALNKFTEWAKANPPSEPFPLASGWHDITPQLSQDLLRRNHGNRKVSFKTVVKYAQAMQRGEWQPTGQPILVNKKGQQEDGQHRDWAGYLSGSTFRSYIVCDVPEIPRIFAFIDDSKPRSMGDAIYTAGNNGMSPIIAAAVKLAWRYENQALGVIKQQKLRDMTNTEALDFVETNPEFIEVAHRLTGSYGKAIGVIGNKAVAVFAAWQISTLHGDDVLDNFLVPLGSGANLDEDSVLLGLRNRLLGEGDNDLKPPHRLALVIKGFNLFLTGAPLGKRGLFVRDNENYPRFEAQRSLPAAAE